MQSSPDPSTLPPPAFDDDDDEYEEEDELEGGNQEGGGTEGTGSVMIHGLEEAAPLQLLG